VSISKQLTVPECAARLWPRGGRLLVANPEGLGWAALITEKCVAKISSKEMGALADTKMIKPVGLYTMPISIEFAACHQLGRIVPGAN